MSDVVLANTLDIKCIFKQAVLLSLFCSGRLYIFFFYLIIKLLQLKKSEVCVEKSFLEHAQSHE